VQIDFGNAMTLHEAQAYYEDFEVQTLYYRAPEVIMGVKFNQQIDTWSLGCLLVELATGKPMFNCTSNQQLFQLMQAVLGPCPVQPFVTGRFFKQYFTPQQQQDMHVAQMEHLGEATVERARQEQAADQMDTNSNSVLHVCVCSSGNENQLIRITNIAKLLHSKDADFVSFVHGLLEYDPSQFAHE
jgi:serine/threonine protein kinase